jgi:hypothetical protein
VVSWVLYVHHQLPEMLQIALEDLIHHLLVLYHFKARFCETFSELYLELLERRHGQELSSVARERRRDVFIFSVQLFTVPSLAVALTTNAKYGQLESVKLTPSSPSVDVRASGLLDGMLQWFLLHLNGLAPGPGGVRPSVVLYASIQEESQPPLDECVDMRASMFGKVCQMLDASCQIAHACCPAR